MVVANLLEDKSQKLLLISKDISVEENHKYSSERRNLPKLDMDKV